MVVIQEASSSSTRPWKYHVFLSFRGEDTRCNFTGHLYSALRQRGIITFMDDQLIRGEEISTALIQAIELSQISIIVFSKDYASSKWCLDELVTILDYKRSNQQIVLPVFYKVDPSEIRNYRGRFGEGLASLECKFKDNLDKVQKWKSALFEAANLSGWPLLDEKCSEASVIKDIAEYISEKLVNSTDLDMAEYQVGIEPRVQQIEKLLGVDGRDVHMVGIWGPGGIGKTTIARAVYNSIAHKFHGSCFLENVREDSKSGGMVKLQKILLREILKDRKLKVTSVARGITMIKERLQGKSVLLVLDDVDDMNQLDSLARQCSWFGMGSRIIITTRDKKLLRCHGVSPDLIYELKELDNQQALELFCVKAFKRIQPLAGFAELTERAVRYTQGLPLALTVLGSSLRGGNVELWEAALDGSESHEIKDVLKISFDGLDHRVKEVFLDIACFYKGENAEHVIKVFEACGSKEHFITVLIEKALISIPYGAKIWMHDLIEEMGRDIVQEQSPQDPGNRSRLWFHEDVYRVLVDNIGTNNVRGIKVELPEDSDVICLSPSTFSNMKNLKLLIYRAGRYSGVFDNLPNSLRVIDWPGCSLPFLPSNTIPRELSLIHMPRSLITVLGDGFKRLINLTSINLSGCEYLTRVSNLSGVPNLHSLDLESCKNLVEVHPSVGFLEKLNYLSLGFCSRLETFPVKVSWKSMRSLLVSHCRSLENFINFVDEMESITKLDLSGSGIIELHCWIGCCTSLKFLGLNYTPIKQLPSAIENLTSLTVLTLSGTPIRELPSWIGCLTSLVTLDLSRSLIEVLPASIGSLTSLGQLDLSRTLITELPSSIGDLTSLRELYLSDTLIEELPLSIGSLTSLRELHLSKTSLEELPSSIGSLTSLSILDASETLIEGLPFSIGNLIGLKYLLLRGCANLTNLPCKVYGLQLLHKLDLSWCLKLVTFPSRVSGLVSSSSESLLLMLPTESKNGHDHPGPLLFPQLRELDFKGCELSVVSDFLGNLDCMSTLQTLNISGSSCDSLPACISKFHKLESLNLGGCKRLQQVSELPPKLKQIVLNDCVSLERFSKLSDILEGKDTPGLRLMQLSNCNRLMNNLGKDLVSKMAKTLPYQLVQAGIDLHLLAWELMLPSLLEIEVPKWFDRGEVEASVVLLDQETGFICEILIEIPRNLKAEKLGLVVCVVLEITKTIFHDPQDSFVTVVIDKIAHRKGHYLEAKPTTESSTRTTRDHVLVCLICIAFNELKLVDHVVRVKCFYKQGVLLKSYGVHLANMQENDGEHASISDFENLEEAAVVSFVSDDSFTGEGNDDHHEEDQEQEPHRPPKRFKWQ